MPRQSLQTIRGCSTDPSWEIFLIYLVFLSRNFSPTQASILFSHYQFLFSRITISRHTHSSIQGQCPPSALVTDWSHACEPSSALLYLWKKRGFYEAFYFAQGISLLSGGKRKCNVSRQAQGGESYKWSKSTVLALALTVLPSPGQVT